jgi:hypothetical protein
MSPKPTKAIKKSVLVIAVLLGVFILYALSLRPVLWLFDTAHDDAGYNSLPYRSTGRCFDGYHRSSMAEITEAMTTIPPERQAE